MEQTNIVWVRYVFFTFADPPGTPVLRVASVAATSAKLEWTTPDSTPIQGMVKMCTLSRNNLFVQKNTILITIAIIDYISFIFRQFWNCCYFDYEKILLMKCGVSNLFIRHRLSFKELATFWNFFLNLSTLR